MPARSLSLRAVVKSYGVQPNAVDGISLEVMPGEFISFLGPSGSGKTTTLMMIAGFQQPSAGEIRLADRAIEGIPPYRRNIGMVFQNYALFPHLTVADNVGFPLRMRKVPRAEKARKVAGALAKVNLTGMERRFPSELSGGQQQRVALARALVFEPDLILLDEPLGALDKNLREQMQMELKRIHRGLGVTMIYVTHDQTEAMAMSDRIAVFNRGRIEQVGPPGEIYFTPETSFVASFVGDSNILEGTSLADGRFRVEGLGPIAAARNGHAPGQAASLLLRPEMVRLAATPAEASAAIEIEARVDHGDHVLVVGAVGGRSLRARIPALDARQLPERGICYVTWRPQDVHVIPH